MSESKEEQEYNDEFARLIKEGSKCPFCNASAKRVESISPGHSALAECTNEHIYILMDADHE